MASLALGEFLAKSWSKTLFTRLLSFKFKSPSPKFASLSCVAAFKPKFFFNELTSALSLGFCSVLGALVSSFRSFLLKFVLARVVIWGSIII